MIDDLRAAWSSAVTPGQHADEVFDDLIRRYNEPHRRYHTVRHLHHVVTDVVAHRDLCNDADATVLAAFFHDAVYAIGASDIEAASAELARTAMASLGFEHQACERVAQLVLATADHHLPAEEALRDDAAVLIDADLAVLAGAPADYRRYVDRVRAEYADIPDDLWHAGRAAVLESFLDRDRIYYTTASQDREAAARRNLSEELSTLGDDGVVSH